MLIIDKINNISHLKHGTLLSMLEKH